MKLFKKIAYVLLFGLMTNFSAGKAETVKRAEEVFHKWFDWQRIMPDMDLTALDQQTDEAFLSAFTNQYEKNIPLLEPLVPFLKDFTDSQINENGYCLQLPIQDTFKSNMAMIHGFINSDMQGFVNYLAKTSFLGQQNVSSEDAGETSHDIIEKDNALFHTLFANNNEELQQKYLFTVANRFFEYCFGEDTFPAFKKMLFNKQSYPIAKLLYAVTWFNLAGNGWKHWHEDSLKQLKALADQGHNFVYIAGGSDLYQLIKAGIYNIKNIDPQLPSQPKYYADDWFFLVRSKTADGGIGDKIVFTFEDRIVTMLRTDFHETGTTFKARIATGDVIELPNSVTTWTFFDQEGKQLGQYVLERRFCEQADFKTEPKKTFLMSFNELYFIALPSILNGWNIDTSRFDKDFSVVIKQLRKPVSRQMAVNMHIATLLNASDFHFIALGTCIN